MKLLSKPMSKFSVQELAVLRAFAYYDIFRFPLTIEEVRLNAALSMNQEETREVLRTLLANGCVESNGEFFGLRGSLENNIAQRYLGEQRRAAVEGKVQRYSQRIMRFPFVEAVAISGSYSKGVLSEDGDIDYFIITSQGRLWICRTLLILFKKIFLFNSRKFFCVNYFIDTAHLVIPDQNLFTATEVKYLLPVGNSSAMQQFYNANSWTDLYLPNKETTAAIQIDVPEKSTWSKMIQSIFTKNMGDWIDYRLMRLTLRRWKKKFPHFDESDFDLNMRTRKNVSKHHPQGFQQKVLDALAVKMQELEALNLSSSENEIQTSNSSLR